MELIDKLNWRYAAKAMNGKKVSQDKIDNISTLTSYWTSKVDVDAAFAVAGYLLDGGSFEFEIKHLKVWKQLEKKFLK